MPSIPPKRTSDDDWLEALFGDDRELTYRSSMLPVGSYRNPDGSESPGFAWPQMALDAKDAIEAPGELLFGDGLDQEEARRRGTIAAGLMMTGGLAAPRPGNALAKPPLGEQNPLGASDYAKAAYKHFRYPDETVDPSVMKEFNNLVEMQQRVRRLDQQNAAEGHLIDKNNDHIRAQVGNQQSPFNDGLIPEQSLSPYDISQFNQQLRQRKIQDGSLFSNGSKGGAGVGLVSSEAASLPMDHASRMARAREMGFDTDRSVYHGSYDDFSEIDPSQSGKRFNQYFDKGGFFTSDNKEFVNQYATIPFGEKNNNYEGRQGAVYPLLTRANNPLRVDDEFLRNELNYNGDLGLLSWDRTGEDLMRLARDGGHDAIHLKSNATSDWDGELRVILDPRNIRSVNAAFDPAKANSANLLAANASPAAGLMSLYGYDDDDLFNY